MVFVRRGALPAPSHLCRPSRVPDRQPAGVLRCRPPKQQRLRMTITREVELVVGVVNVGAAQFQSAGRNPAETGLGRVGASAGHARLLT